MSTANPSYRDSVHLAIGEIGVLAYWHTVLIRIADNADGMTPGLLREEIRWIAEQVRDRESVRRAGEVTS